LGQFFRIRVGHSATTRLTIDFGPPSRNDAKNHQNPHHNPKTHSARTPHFRQLRAVPLSKGATHHPPHSPHCFGFFKRSMIQADYLPLCEMLDSSVIAEAFEEDSRFAGVETAEV